VERLLYGNLYLPNNFTQKYLLNSKCYWLDIPNRCWLSIIILLSISVFKFSVNSNKTDTYDTPKGTIIHLALFIK